MDQLAKRWEPYGVSRATLQEWARDRRGVRTVMMYNGELRYHLDDVMVYERERFTGDVPKALKAHPSFTETAKVKNSGKRFVARNKLPTGCIGSTQLCDRWGCRHEHLKKLRDRNIGPPSHTISNASHSHGLQLVYKISDVEAYEREVQKNLPPDLENYLTPKQIIQRWGWKHQRFYGFRQKGSFLKGTSVQFYHMIETVYRIEDVEEYERQNPKLTAAVHAQDRNKHVATS